MKAKIKQTGDNAKQPSEQTVLYGSFQHPVLTKICEAINQIAGVSMVVVLPKSEAWEHVRVSGASDRPAFCKLIHGTRKGLQSCQLSHVLMALSASHDGVSDRCCHAGLVTLAIPAPAPYSGELAVVSSCMFTTSDKEKIWRTARRCGPRLKLDQKELRAAFDKLPVVTGKKLNLVRTLLSAAMAMIVEMKARHDLEKALHSTITREEIPA